MTGGSDNGALSLLGPLGGCVGNVSAATAYSEPGFGARLEAVREAARTGSLEGSVPIEDIVPDWPDRLNRR